MVEVTKRDAGWWDDFFPAFRPIFGIVSRKVTNAHVRYVIEKLNLKPGKKFLDCPCGIGRISLPLAKKGIRVTGVDITQSYLDELSRRTKQRGLKISVARADMRRVNYDSQFDAAGNLWTSFGFFEKESDNRLVLKKMYQALKPGGRFMLHVINRDWIIARFQPSEFILTKDGLKVGQVRSFDYERSTNLSTWYFIKNGKEQSFDISIRMYSFHELAGMFESVGFTDIQGYGSVKDDPISRDRGMMFIIGTKPRRR
jgi:ubiquinone/menaquinone biosynthesis C-methylase UbiE